MCEELQTKCDVCEEMYEDDEVEELEDTLYFVCMYCVESFDQCCGDKTCDNKC